MFVYHKQVIIDDLAILYILFDIMMIVITNVPIYQNIKINIKAPIYFFYPIPICIVNFNLHDAEDLILTVSSKLVKF